MKKISMLSALAVCALALPLAAAVLDPAINNHGSINGSVNGQANHMGKNSNASMEATVDAKGNINRSAQRHIEERVHKNYRSYAKRLNKVETRVLERGKKAGGWTAEQVQERRDRIRAIRAKFRDKGDKLGDQLSDADKKEFDVEITFEEDAVAKADRN